MNANKYFIGVLFLILIIGHVAAHSAEIDGITFEYGNNWRISGKTTDKLTLTHIEKPGEVLLSVSKIPAEGNLIDMWNMYKEKLVSFGAEIEELPPGNAAGQSTIRFLTRLPNQPDVIVLNQLFEANGNFYLATVTAKEDDFITYAREAEPVIKSMMFSGKAASASNIRVGESDDAPFQSSIISRFVDFIKTLFSNI